MACPPLPLDVVYMIIDCLHDHKPTLKACSRVCKAWIRPARRLLFMTLALNQYHIQRLRNLGVESHRRVVLAYVRHVILLGIRGEQDGPLWAEAMPLLASVENTRRLIIADCRICPSMQSSLIDHLPNIVILIILRFPSNSFSDLVQMICAFPRLEEMTLTLTAPSWLNPDPPPIAYRLPPSLRSLRLTFCNELIPIMEWLAPQQPSSMQTFCLDYSAPSQRAVPHINKFLQHLGPVLETVEFTGDGCTFFSPPSLNHNALIHIIQKRPRFTCTRPEL